MECFYDVCGVNLRIYSGEDFSEPLFPIFKRTHLDTTDISVELKAGVDNISVEELVWNDFDQRCLAHVRADGSSVYEYSYPEPGELVCRMETSPDYSKAVIAYVENIGRAARGWLAVMLKLIYTRHMITRGGLVLHAVSVLADGGAVLFSGPSGMGKSTQAGLWVEHLGAEIINGDRTTLDFRCDILYATGSAWSGSSYIFTELAAPVKAVVFLEQAKEDTVRRLDAGEALQNVIPRSFLPYYNSRLMEKAMENIDRMMGCMPFFLLRNTATLESVRVLKEALDTPS